MKLMGDFVSIIVPNHNGRGIIGACLGAALESDYQNYEVVVVDDASTDGSIEEIKKFPVRLIPLEEHAGVSKARNKGAEHSRGDILLFIDSDCLLERDALARISSSMRRGSKVVGGTYTPIPADPGFFSTFQSVFINYNETRGEPDYIAAHCLAIDRAAFKELGGFIEDSYMGVEAGVEDVEFSHRLKRAGYTLRMDPGILVRHIFNFDFFCSLANASRRSMTWTMYSLGNRDVLRDSGTASLGLKFNVSAYPACIILAFLYPPAVPAVAALNLLVNRGLIAAFHRAEGTAFALKAAAYYFLVYPLPVGAGALAGLLRYLWEVKLTGRYR